MNLLVSARRLPSCLFAFFLFCPLSLANQGDIQGSKSDSQSTVQLTLTEKQIYERELIKRSLQALGLVLEATPQGKVISRIELVRYPIVEKSDPWPDFVNLFHVTTREHIVRQELMFRAGETYDEQKVRESARNLRSLPLLFSTVRIVTAHVANAPDEIVVVVITKDLWSIRLNSNFNFGGGIFNFFFLAPSEQNLLGYNQQVSLYLYLDRDVNAFGQIYRVPRILGTRLQLEENLVARVNHHRNDLEGGTGSLILRRPLFSVATKWSFYVKAGFDVMIFRDYNGADMWRVSIQDQSDVYWLPTMYKKEIYSFQSAVTRSFGSFHKLDVALGYEAYKRNYRVTDGFLLLPEHVLTEFQEKVLPIQDKAAALVASVHYYTAEYSRLHNVQTLGLTEDFRMGPSVVLKLSFANPAFGFFQNSLSIDFAADYNRLLAGGILSFSSRLQTRYYPQNNLVSADFIDQLAQLQLKYITPEIFNMGRLVTRLQVAYSRDWLTRFHYALGGENTLRGYISGFAAGTRLFNVNVEFRSLPWVLYTIHLGFVVFYDAGDAYDYAPQDDFRYHQSLGFGIRTLIPQFDRGVFRLDVGIPLGVDFHSRFVEWVTIAFLQAF